jgi:uncharacterized protein YjbI with pentapeptide repeats
MKSKKKEQSERPSPVDVDGTAMGPEEKKRLYAATGPTRPGGPARPDPSDSPTIPGQLAPDWIYKNIQEASVNCRKLLFIYLALLSYGTLSALTTPVENLFLGQSIEMPIIKATIPLNYFLIITPLLAIGLFIYNQLHLRKINRLIEYAIKECQAIHPNCDHTNPALQHCTFNDICRHQENRLYPWIFIFSRYSRVKTVRKFQHAFIWCSLWFFLPATLITFTLFVLKKHDHLLFYLMFSMTVAGIVVVFFFWNFQQNQLNAFRFMVSDQQTQFSFFLIFILLFSAFFISLHIQSRNGRLWWVEDSVWKYDAKLHNRILRSTIFVNLEDRQLATGTSDDQDRALILKNTHLEGANFSYANLEKANLTNAHIINAKLEETKLMGADLSRAKLNGANLSGSKLIKAKFKGATLKNCDLVMADLTQADFFAADMVNSDLRHANLEETNLTHTIVSFANFRDALNLRFEQIKQTVDWQLAYFDEELSKELGLPASHNDNLKKKNLQGYPLAGIVFWNRDFSGFDFTDSDLNEVTFPSGTDLRGAIFENAELSAAILVKANLTNANLVNVNLSDSDLTGATLRGADLSDTMLDKAIVQWTDFRGATGLSDEAVKKTKHYQLAYFDPDMLGKLGLPADHNNRLMSRNLSGSDFKNTELSFKGANFSGTTLTAADFQGVNLEAANFNGTCLKEANLTGAILHWATFGEADLDGCSLEQAAIFWADFRSAENLTKDQVISAKGYQLAQYNGALRESLTLPFDHNDRLDGKSLYNYNLEGSQLAGANLNKTDLRNARLKGADLTGALLYRANLKQADLRGAILTNAYLAEADLQYADLGDADGLSFDQLSQAANSKLAYYNNDWLKRLGLPLDHKERLNNKDLHGYKFNKNNLGKANLKATNLMGADLENADLSDAQLQKADLTMANGHGAILTDAYLIEAKLCYTNLKNADLRGADLRGIRACR